MCIVEAPERTVPFEVTADFGYFRLRQPTYDDAEMAALAERIQSVAGGWRDVFAYFKHEEDGAGPALATRLRALLEGASAPVAASR
jgi:uncharacterized protein YecE (DUF72 family)